MSSELILAFLDSGYAYVLSPDAPLAEQLRDDDFCSCFLSVASSIAESSDHGSSFCLADLYDDCDFLCPSCIELQDKKKPRRRRKRR